jgi:hypothetical protein
MGVEARALVTDPWHRPPSPQNTDRWLVRCLERVSKGWVHPVFADDFTASFYKAHGELVMQGVSRDGGVRQRRHWLVPKHRPVQKRRTPAHEDLRP